MNISAVSAAGRSNSHVGGSQDQVVMDIKTKIKEVKQEIQKVNRSRDLTDDQKKAKREMLQTQLDTLQQQLAQRQQQLREERQKEAEKAAEQKPEKTRSVDENKPSIDEKTAGALVATDLDIKHIERLDTVRISLEGQAKVLAAQNESDTVNLGSTLEINYENAAELKDRIRSLDREIGGRLADINDIDKTEEKDTSVQKNGEQDTDKKQDGALEKDEKHVDTWA
ncbi:FlxA-like family protein [Anaerotruncus colihominis]|uniref:Uncharacterized protein n=1 Tax=Anaerotruncus colihominis TaxID=169435 RepID=A0A845SUP8_9FIRM|nr:FlxA-like family protein [Anaerotruncus colihominis]MCR2025821.1 FlxA-like family protein [Anaerotruncus colihominis]NDO38628.1 hypothetical protein [Anaerotruncus colihominis]